MRRLAIAAALALIAGCSSSEPSPFEPGTESFTSSPPGYGGRTGDFAGIPGPAAPQAPSGAEGDASPRAVEEADVYVRTGSTLYVLNAYRGLQIVDLSDPAAPRLLGRAPLGGVPVDLYVRDGVALVLTRENVVFAADAATGVPGAWIGSRFWAVDARDPASPRVVAELPIEGNLEATRIVGDVLYVVSTRHAYWSGVPVPVANGVGGAVDPAEDTLLVASIDVADAGSPRLVDALQFPASGWETHANVTPERITLSFARMDLGGEVTRFRAIDISDPGGALALGAEVSAEGLARDRWGLDFDAATGLFRAVVANGWNAGAKLHVFRWPEFGAAQRAGSLALDVREGLTASRFDGSRVYVVTALQSDPLWVVDTSDPDAPRLLGHLEMPGQIDHIEPRGDLLLAFGRTNEAGGWLRLHVSLIDVSDPARPTQIQRRVFGPDGGWVPASRDDFRKVFLVLDDENLVVVPYQGWDYSSYAWSGGTKLFSFTRDSLTERGFLAHAGDVKRAFSIAPGKLAALSDQKLQTIDASNPDAPVTIASLDLARPALDVAVVNGAAVVASGDGWRDDVRLVFTDASDPDAAAPSLAVQLPGPSARLFEVGDAVWALVHEWNGGSSLWAADVSDPAHPRLISNEGLPIPFEPNPPAPLGLARAALDEGGLKGGVADLRQEIGASADIAPGWWWPGLNDAVQVGHFLAVQDRGWYGAGATKVLVFDLSDPAAPRLAASIALQGVDWIGGLVASEESVWAVFYAWADPGSWSRVRYHAARIDLSGALPRLAERVNIPGMLLAATDGGRLYTWETVWDGGGAEAPVYAPVSPSPTTWVHALELTPRGTARLVASRSLPGYASGFLVDGGVAHGLLHDSGRSWIAVGDASAVEPRAQLVSVRLDSLQVSSGEAVPRGWASLVAVKGGKVFLQTGWPAQELLVYGSHEGELTFEQAFPSPGWPVDVEVEGDRAYVAAGPYGVNVVPLSGVSSSP